LAHVSYVGALLYLGEQQRLAESLETLSPSSNPVGPSNEDCDWWKGCGLGDVLDELPDDLDPRNPGWKTPQQLDLIPINEVCKHTYCHIADISLDVASFAAGTIVVARDCFGQWGRVARATGYNVANIAADPILNVALGPSAIGTTPVVEYGLYHRSGETVASC
jgi:hypothetical protein